ncbi:MAG: aspartate--tRNA ligase [Defluviitaleaceae bacterium]|nr:aspartate--tRNA ligase [Defluviitaleaceae bacterium]
MSENLSGMKRTHYLGDVNESMIGDTVTVMGFINKRRDLGKLIFIAMRDRTGILQVTIDGDKASDELFKKAETVRGEYVIAVKGIVCARNEKDINPNMKTGKVELEVLELRILSEAAVPPFQVADTGVAIDMRLKYRYIDLRRPELQRNLFLRHKASQSVRNFLSDEGFIDVETPMLTKSTPEGARDYLVPSRIHQGKFYALPQSPQIFKQLLMVSGFDRYYQIVKCFRDEDLRADRQPEFTQIDIEMSFVDIEDIIEVNERLMKTLFKDVLNLEIKTPFPRITFNEAMERFGSDKPDMRFGLEIVDISDIVKGSEFNAFENAITSGGSVRGINATGAGNMPRKQIDSLVEHSKTYGANGLAWITITEKGEFKTSLSKFFDDAKLIEIKNAFGAKNGDTIFLCAAKTDVVLTALGAVRLEFAKRLELVKQDEYNFVWVTEWPLLEWSEEDNRFYAKHHPFTSPMDEDVELLKAGSVEDRIKIRAKAYDLVLNGNEIGGGSLRIYNSQIQEKMFEVLGFSKEEAHERFGFMLDAFRYGVPPHGGIAFGFDRLVMLLTGEEAIKDVIAFPKVNDASCPMTDAPNVVDIKQLDELGIAVKETKE